MQKTSSVVLVIMLLFFQLTGETQAQKAGSDVLTPLERTTYTLLKNGYNFTGSRFPEQWSFQKTTDSGKHVVIFVGTDPLGAVKFFLIRVPTSAWDKETEILFVGVLGIAQTRGAKTGDSLALADWFADHFWPREKEALKAGKRIETGKFGVVFNSLVTEKGDVQIEIK